VIIFVVVVVVVVVVVETAFENEIVSNCCFCSVLLCCPLFLDGWIRTMKLAVADEYLRSILVS